jgi:integrase
MTDTKLRKSELLEPNDENHFTGSESVMEFFDEKTESRRLKKDIKAHYDLSPIESAGQENVFVAAILDTRRAKSTGLYPVKVRITHLGKQIYYPCIDISAEEYSRLHKAIRSPELLKTRKSINATFTTVWDIVKELIDNEGFTLEGLNLRLKRGSKNSLFAAFDTQIAELKEKGKVGSVVWYTCAKNSVEKFARKDLTEDAVVDLKFSDITPSWLTKYQAQLEEEGKAYTTISINMRAVRAIMNGALREGIIARAQYPFQINKNGKYRIPEGKGRKIALNEAQIIEVFNHPLHPDDEKWRDLWIFSFYCNGANLSDMLQFKYENIINGCIEWHRKKTLTTDINKTKIRAYINEEMAEIISRHGNPDKKPSNYIFPYLSKGLSPFQTRAIVQEVIHQVNKRMKKIGKALGYGDITTYWARHSYASISRSKGVQTFSISKSLGHKNLSTTEIYLDSLSDDEIIQNASVLPKRNGHEKPE